MIDLGLLITGLAAFAALFFGKGHVTRHVLFVAWAIGFATSFLGAPKAGVVLSLAISDLLITGISVIAVHHDDKRVDSRLVGGLSLLLMPAHFAMSASQGAASWILYVSCCNAIFVLQCLVVGGWADDLGRRLWSFIHRALPILRSRHGNR